MCLGGFSLRNHVEGKKIFVRNALEGRMGKVKNVSLCVLGVRKKFFFGWNPK